MHRLAAVVVLAACSSSSTPSVAPHPSATRPTAQLPSAPEDKESELITKQLVEMNSSEYAAPSRQFQAGTVSVGTPPQVKRTEHGFEVQFSNRSAVSTPAVYGGRVLSSGGFNSRELFAFDARTGATSYALALSDDGPSAIACQDDICVFNTESCTTFAIDARTGKQKWAWFLGDPQTSSPSIAGGLVFTSYPAGGAQGDKPRPPSATHVLAAFDLHTGEVKWQDWLDADVISAPVAVGEFLYVATYNGSVIKLEQATGKIRYASKANATSAPVVQFVAGLESMYYTQRSDAQIAGAAPAASPAAGSAPVHASPDVPAAPTESIVRTDHNEPQTRYKAQGKSAGYLDASQQDRSAMKDKAAAADSGNGFANGAPASANAQAAAKLVGQSNVSTIQQFQGSRILHTAGRNVNTMGDEVIATDPENGQKLWSHKLDGDLATAGGELASPPLAAGKHIIVATLAGDVLDLDPATGATRATYHAGGAVRSQPVVVDGWIYVGTDDGRLVAIDTGDRELTGWPMWGGNAARTGDAAP